MRSIFLGAICSLAALCCFGQQQFTISGYIKDVSNGEALIGATVFIPEISKGTISNVYGFYSITLPEGKYNIDYQYVGFTRTAKNVVLDQNIRLDLELSPAAEELKEVLITSKAIDENVQSVEMSTAELDIKTIEKLPSFAGEVDVIRSIQMLPGVTTVGEGASGFNVRGGSVGQNLVLLDEAPVYQSSHLFGFFSVFNPDAVKDVKLYKGGIPAQYGGKLSSILDIRMKEGNNKEYDVTGGIGTIFSRLAVEGPIKKDKSSFIIAGRRSYGDVLAKAFTDALSDGAQFYFYDLTAKTNFNINEKNRLFLSGYMGRDVLRVEEFIGFDWGNMTTTLRWNHLYSSKLFSNYTVLYSNYDYGLLFGENKNDYYKWKSRIRTWNFKPEYTWFINTSNELTFGADVLLYNFEPAEAKSVTDGLVNYKSIDERRAIEASLHISNEQQLSGALSIAYGLRYSHFSNMGGKEFHYADTIPGIRKRLSSIQEKDDWETIASYGNFEPRFSLKLQLSKTASLKASYNRMNQYTHLISNTTASTPVDIWQPSNNNLKPQRADQIALGYFRNFQNHSYEASVETYYKNLENQVDYIDGADLFINDFLEADLLSGIGRAYGVELYAKKNTGKLTGWIAYTAGKSESRVDGINFGSDLRNRKGNWYPTRYDQRHNLKVATFYELNSKMSLSANFTLVSGTPATFPTDRLTIQGYVIPHIADNKRNNYRIPAYHRLDLAVTFNNIWRGRKGRKGEDNLVVSVYNVYARKNPFSIYFAQEKGRLPGDKPVNTTATQVSLIGTFVPAVSYNFKF